MNTTSQQRLLYAIAGAGVLATAGVIYWATSSIVDETSVSSSATKDRNAGGGAETESGSTIDDSALAMTLRGPLYDPPPSPPRKPPPVTVATPKPVRQQPLNLTLVGTIINSGESLAIVSDEAGNFDVKGVGDALELTPEGVQIQKIAAEQITLRYQGNESTIRLEKDKKPKAVGRRNRGRKP